MRYLTVGLLAGLKDYAEDALLELKGLAVEILVELIVLVVEVLAFPFENYFSFDSNGSGNIF